MWNLIYYEKQYDDVIFLHYSRIRREKFNTRSEAVTHSRVLMNRKLYNVVLKAIYFFPE